MGFYNVHSLCPTFPIKFRLFILIQWKPLNRDTSVVDILSRLSIRVRFKTLPRLNEYSVYLSLD